MPPGPTLNTYPTGSVVGYRTVPSGIWVKAAGCYGLQIDGLTFTRTIVVHAVPNPRQAPQTPKPSIRRRIGSRSLSGPRGFSADAGRYHQLLMTTEPQLHVNRSGPALLSAPFGL